MFDGEGDDPSRHEEEIVIKGHLRDPADHAALDLALVLPRPLILRGAYNSADHAAHDSTPSLLDRGNLLFPLFLPGLWTGRLSVHVSIETEPQQKNEREQDA
jgi:hypothetical protein